MKFRFHALTLSAICIFSFILQLVIPNYTDLLILNQSSFFEPWRFLTSIFLHADLAHLIYNLFALLFFGLILEKLTSPNKFLAIFFFSGIIANIFSVNFYSSSLGASGAIFGIIGALVIVRPTMTVWAFSMPMPMFLAGIVWAVGDIIGAVAYFSGNPLSNTGNLAHLSGMFIGLIFGLFYRNWNYTKKQNKLEIDEASMQRWEDNYF